MFDIANEYSWHMRTNFKNNTRVFNNFLFDHVYMILPSKRLIDNYANEFSFCYSFDFKIMNFNFKMTRYRFIFRPEDYEVRFF